ILPEQLPIAIAKFLERPAFGDPSPTDLRSARRWQESDCKGQNPQPVHGAPRKTSLWRPCKAAIGIKANSKRIQFSANDIVEPGNERFFRFGCASAPLKNVTADENESCVQVSTYE